MKSEFRQIEVFITSDGEEFIDEDSALEHQEFIYAKEAFLDLVDCAEDEAEYVIGKMRPYLDHIMERIDSKCLSF